MKKIYTSPFPTVLKLAKNYGCDCKGFHLAAKKTIEAEKSLQKALFGIRTLNPDSSLILFGSFARHEMLNGSDYDWALLVDGVANVNHIEQTRNIDDAIRQGLTSPGQSGTFGNMVFSHDLVHCIGGGSDSNANLTRRMLMLLESRSFNLPHGDNSLVWENVVSNILKRYFEEEVHFSPAGERTVPRFLLNDLTRYWRTICVDYAAKYREQDGRKWALRNAKIRFSRKLLYAAGLAFCFSCELDPPKQIHQDLFGMYQNRSAEPFIESALKFARTPPLEYLAAFIEAFIPDLKRREQVFRKIFGSYNEWLILLNDKSIRSSLEKLKHGDSAENIHFKKIRKNSSVFASGLRQLFFNRDSDEDHITNLSLEYVGF